jgi:heme/copper-type cytochrome/quinol oxidase subunit 3
MVVLLLVAGSAYGCVVFAYLYLWTVSPEVWPAAELLPGAASFAVPATLLAASSAAFGLANRALDRGKRIWPGVVAAIALAGAAFAVHVHAHWALAPVESSYGALVYLVLALEGFFGAASVTLALFALARATRGLVDRVRRVTFDNARLFWHYSVGQGLVGLALVHGFPRLVG